jgi:hypothetical protein
MENSFTDIASDAWVLRILMNLAGKVFWDMFSDPKTI